MSHMSNRTILEKADFALSHLVTHGGLLHPAQAKKFMRLTTVDSVLLGQVTYRPMNRGRVVGVRRKIRIEWERSIRRRALAVVVTLEADTKFAEEEGVVLATNVIL